MPDRRIATAQIDPIVQHGLRELAMGAPIEHVLREATLIAALVGAGMSMREALAYVEEREAELIGLAPGEERERAHRPIPTPYPYGKSGRYPGGMPGGYPGGIPGGYPGGIPGGYPGGIRGGYPGGIPGGYAGGIPGGYPGGYPGGMWP